MVVTTAIVAVSDASTASIGHCNNSDLQQVRYSPIQQWLPRPWGGVGTPQEKHQSLQESQGNEEKSCKNIKRERDEATREADAWTWGRDAREASGEEDQ